MKKPTAPESGTGANFALALLSAAFLVALFPRFNLVWLAPFALTPLLIALARERRALFRFLLGYAAGIVYWFGVCYWIEAVLDHYGAMGPWAGWGTFLLFCLVKGLHLGAFALLAAVLMPKPYAIPAVAALWTGIERTHGPLGFAWLTLGDAGTSMGLPMRLAPFTGVYGLSFVFATLAAALALVVLRRKRKELFWLAPLLVLPLLPALPPPQAGDRTALLVQPNVPEDFEWTPASLHQFERSLLDLSLGASFKSPAAILVWPEAPIPLYYDLDPGIRLDAQALAQAAHAYFLFGSVGAAPNGDPTNSAILLDPLGRFAGRYDKNYLVPFGEYIPPLFGWVKRITQEAGDFAPGHGFPVLPIDRHKMGVFICYESAFPHLVRQFAAHGADLLVNISNDGYFGTSAAREQHLKLVRMRAAENGRWILRATNDGITAAIDPAGRVAATTAPFARTVTAVSYGYRAQPAFYSLHGDWFAWGCLGFALLALVAARMPAFSKAR